MLAQSFNEWEQIIIDDGSVDATCQKAQMYKDKRIKLLKQKHCGIENLRETYNKALALAEGEFIAILEGDDFWPPHKLEKQLPLFDHKEVVLTWGAALWVHEDGRPIVSSPSDIDRYLDLPRHKYLEELLLKNFIPAVTVILRKEVLLSIGGFRQLPYLPTVDYPTWLQCALKGEIAGTKDVVGYWRRHGSQMSTARQHEIMNGAVRLACEFYDTLPADIKAKLHIKDSKKIRRHWYDAFAASSFYEGRKHLVKRRWKGARREFLTTIRLGNTALRLKSLLGLIASYGHFNIERIARAIGKEKVKEEEIWAQFKQFLF